MISITSMGLLCSLGNKLDEIGNNLNNLLALNFKESDYFLIGNKKSYFGFIESDLVKIPSSLKDHDSRNNRVLLQAFLQIEQDVIKAIEKYGKDRVGIVLGTTTSGIHESDLYYESVVHNKEYKDWTYTLQEIGDGSAFLSKYLKLDGIAYTISTACSSSARAIITGKNLIENNVLDAVIVGGADTLSRMPINGFDSLDSLSYDICRPFANDRQGINIGEAAGLMLLERDSSDLSIKGFGQSSDGYHISAPHPEGIGAKEAIYNALKMANLDAYDLGYINLHGTATILNDKVEHKVIQDIFNNKVPCSSIKYLLGHTLGAAGICEGIISALILRDDLYLPKQNCSQEEIDPSFGDFGLLTDAKVKLQKPYIMSNSFAFGGNNVSIIFAKEK